MCWDVDIDKLTFRPAVQISIVHLPGYPEDLSDQRAVADVDPEDRSKLLSAAGLVADAVVLAAPDWPAHRHLRLVYAPEDYSIIPLSPTRAAAATSSALSTAIVPFGPVRARSYDDDDYDRPGSTTKYNNSRFGGARG